MISTANFNPRTDPKLLCTCGHPKCDKRSVNQATLNRMQALRNAANRPLIVRSGGRCPHHPDELHRTTPADHQNCIVLDIECSGGIEKMELVRLGFVFGATAMGVGKTFVHLAWRDLDDADKPVMWTY